HFDWLRPDDLHWQVFLCGTDHLAALARDALHRGGDDRGRANMSADNLMTRWLLVAIMVTSTVIGDVLQSKEMKKGFGYASRKYLVLAVAFMAVSFFAFVKL